MRSGGTAAKNVVHTFPGAPQARRRSHRDNKILINSIIVEERISLLRYYSGILLPEILPGRFGLNSGMLRFRPVCVHILPRHFPGNGGSSVPQYGNIRSWLVPPLCGSVLDGLLIVVYAEWEKIKREKAGGLLNKPALFSNNTA